MRHERLIDGVIALAILSLLTAAVGCGQAQPPQERDWSVDEGSGDETGYEEEASVVVTAGDDGEEIIITGTPDECVDINGTCVDTEKAKEEKGGLHCDNPDARADYIMEEGEVVDVICYPPKDDGTDIKNVEKDGEGNAEVPQTDNGTVVTFGEDTNGEPITGDINLDAERTTIYGNGVDKTLIDGNVTVESNNSRVRSLTVQGDVTYLKTSNGSALSFCKIEGSLAVNSNDFTATNCKVFGDVTVSGNGARLVNIGVQGAWEVNNSADCRGCYQFADENDDMVVEEDEVGEDLTCTGKP